jgi:hypothetical protein
MNTHMHTLFARCWVCLLPLVLWLFALSGASGQQLLHRYSFDADATDVIGGADGQLVGDATIAGGAVVLSGNKPSYVNLPNDLVASLSNVTFEIWVIWNGGSPWQRIWDFGDSGSEDNQAAAQKSIFLTPNNGGGMQLSIFPTTAVFGQQTLNAPTLSVGQLHHIVWTYAATNVTGILYLDGAQIALNGNMPARLSDLGITPNNWLGHSQYSQDADFAGSIAEFRIYDGPISAGTVRTNFLTGPDPTGRGPIVNLQLNARLRMRPGTTQQLQVIGDFQNVSGVELTSDPGVTFEVSNPALMSVATGGLLTAIGDATAFVTVTASYQGLASSQEIELLPATVATLLHRYSFDDNALDLVGVADGELVGDAMITSGAVLLSGHKPSYVNLPNELVTGLSSTTFEIWVSWNGGLPWQRIWDFGNSGAEDGQAAAFTSLFLTPDNGGGMQLSLFPTTAVFGQQVINAPRLTVGQLHHLVWTYDDLVTTGTLYLDGTVVGVNRNLTVKPSDLGSTYNNWLGHSQYIQDADFAGSIAEFRVYEGVLTASQIATNTAVGPDPSGRGLLVGLTLSARPVMLVGGKQQLQVKANFERVAGIDITGDAAVQFTVADLTIFNVSQGGLLTSVGSGAATARVTASYQGRQAVQDIQVIAPAPPQLLHRYRFELDANDSVGTAHGELVGDAAIHDNAVVLTGRKPSYVNLPNNLLDGLTDVTLEFWLTWSGGSVWQRLIDAGNSTAGEDNQGAATQSLFLTPNNGGVMDLSIFPDGIGGQQVINGPPLTPGTPHHLVWSYSQAATTSRLFVDGAENGVNYAMTYTLQDLGPLSNVWLGHSQYVQDADFSGVIAEFRVYQGTFNDAEVAAALEAGPDELPSERALRRLKIRSGAHPGELILFWPKTADGFQLEASANLGPTSAWTRVDTEPTLSGDFREVTVTVTPSTRFFRLRN